MRHAIITGGSSGIGLALATLLHKAGWNLSLIARNANRLQAAKSGLAGKADIQTYPVDVTDRDHLQTIITEAVATSGSPDLLITCAGIARPGYFSELAADDFETLNRVNYLGTVYSVQAVVPYMRNAHSGHIVMVASGAALVGLFGYTAYAPSKFAVRGFAESLRPELKSDGIRVSIVYPPDTQTPQLIEEEKTKPPETRFITASGGVMTAEAVASKILAGIRGNRFSITPGAAMFWLHALHSLAGPLLRFYFDHRASKAKQEINKS